MYRESQLDKRNKDWFERDTSVNSLKCITITNGHIRGVFPMNVLFKYPISAFVGENGSGKSTLLALVSCAFHNTTAFCPQNRIRPNVTKLRTYYTYGDFFTFFPSENGISEIQIRADYLSATGMKSDIRKKKPSGKWNDFNRRPPRAVSFLGINRIVPPSESSPHRHYCRLFSPAHSLNETQISELSTSLSKILGRSYNNIDLLEYGAYRLFAARRNETDYTGFNMGAGENAVLGLLLEVMSAGRGALIVVDEIELGLHAKAQKALIEELKSLCDKYHCQIVCSTHSKTILDALPPEARFFIRREDRLTDIIPNISSEYAFGQLSGIAGRELSVFVEDAVGKDFLQNMISHSLRERVRFYPIGSDQAVLRHIAVHYREKEYGFIAFLDGDKRAERASAIQKVKDNLEGRIDHTDEEFASLIGKRLCYLPGNIWPEKHLIEEAIRQDNHESLCSQWGLNEATITGYLEEALNAGKHSEFYSLSQNLQLEIEQTRADIIRFYRSTHPDDVNLIEDSIRQLLS